MKKLNLGLYKDVIYCPASTSVARALFILDQRNISSILVTNKQGRMTTIFQRSDIFKLDIMDIDMFEQISSALNHVENNMLDDMVLGEISNLLIKYEEFMNNKIRD